jgi:hypothetical protein
MSEFVRQFWSKLQYLRLVRFFQHTKDYLNSWKHLK